MTVDASGALPADPSLTTTRGVLRRGLLEALGMPSFVLVASMMGFGSLVREAGYGLPLAIASTVGIWGLPGQVAMIEMTAAGAGIAATVLAASIANARFFPMAISFMPLLRPGLRRPGWLFALAHLQSIQTWAAGMRMAPQLSPRLRVVYYTTFSLTCIAAAAVGTAIGYLAAGALPRPVTLALIFLNVLFFALVFAGSRDRAVILSLALGAVLGPGLHHLSADWGVLIAGVVAGSLAYWLTRGQDPKGSQPGPDPESAR